MLVEVPCSLDSEPMLLCLIHEHLSFRGYGFCASVHCLDRGHCHSPVLKWVLHTPLWIVSCKCFFKHIFWDNKGWIFLIFSAGLGCLYSLGIKIETWIILLTLCKEKGRVSVCMHAHKRNRKHETVPSSWVSVVFMWWSLGHRLISDIFMHNKRPFFFSNVNYFGMLWYFPKKLPRQLARVEGVVNTVPLARFQTGPASSALLLLLASSSLTLVIRKGFPSRVFLEARLLVSC